MGAHDQVPARSQPELVEDPASLASPGSVVLQHLAHGRTGLDDRLGPQSLGEQVAPGMLGERHVDVAQVVDDLAVEFLRDPLVEAAVAGLHVEDRDLPALRRNDAEAGVGVAVEQQGVGLLGLEHLVALHDHLPDGPGHALLATPR